MPQNLKELLGSKTQEINCCFTTELFYLHKRKLNLVNMHHSNISMGILLLNLIIIILIWLFLTLYKMTSSLPNDR